MFAIKEARKSVKSKQARKQGYSTHASRVTQESNQKVRKLAGKLRDSLYVAKQGSKQAICNKACKADHGKASKQTARMLTTKEARRQVSAL